MSAPSITEPDKVSDIKSLHQYVTERLGPGGRGYVILPPHLIARLNRGALRRYNVEDDARASFLCGDPDWICLNFHIPRYEVKLRIMDDAVEIRTRNRDSGGEISIHPQNVDLAIA